MTAVRCLCCGVLHLTVEAYLSPTHRCSGRPEDTATVTAAVEQPTTASPASPWGDAVVIPFSRRPRWHRPTGVTPA